MPSTQSAAPYSNQSGVFSQALSWLRHRNRLHAPTVTLATAIGSHSHAARTVSRAQGGATCGPTPAPTQPPPPLRWSPAAAADSAAARPLPPSAAAVVTEAAAVGDGASAAGGPSNPSRRHGMSPMRDAWGLVNGRPPHRPTPHHDLVVDWDSLDPQQQLALLPNMEGGGADASTPAAPARLQPDDGPTSSDHGGGGGGGGSSRATRHQHAPLALQPQPQPRSVGALESRGAAEAAVLLRRRLELPPATQRVHSHSHSGAPAATHGSLTAGACPPPAAGAMTAAAVAAAAAVASPPAATGQTGAAVPEATRGAASAVSGSYLLDRQLPAVAWRRPSGPGRLGGAALSTAIRAVESLDELADLYDAHHDTFRSGHVSAALARLPHAAGLRRLTCTPRLTEARHGALLAELLRRFEGHRAADEYGTRDVSNVAWVLGTLGRREYAGLVSELATNMLGLRQRHLRQQLAASSATAATAANGPGVTSADAAAADAAAADAPGHASDCTALDLSNMALGMAKVGVTSPPLWQQLTEAAAAAIATPRGAKGFGCQETANFAWSLAQAHREFCRRQAVGGGGFGAAAAAVDVGDLSGDSEGGAADAEWRGFAAWPAGGGSGGGSGAPPPPPSAARTQHPAWACWLRPFVEKVLAPRVRLKLPAYSAQEAANAAWALAALGHADRGTMAAVAAAAARAAAAAAAGRASLAPAAVSMFVWALATMAVTQRSCSTSIRASSTCSSSSDCSIRCSVSSDGSGGDVGNSSGSDDSNNGHSRVSRHETATDGEGGSNTERSSSIRGGSSAKHRTRNAPTNVQSQLDSGAQLPGSNMPEELPLQHLQHHPESLTALRGPTQAATQERQQRHQFALQQDQQPFPQQPQQGQPEQHPEQHPQLHPQLHGPHPRPSPAVDPAALLALSRAAMARMGRFTPQGLSNLLWGLGVLGFRSPREVQELAARAALLRLGELQPLGLATLLEDWARSRRYHPGLFAAAAPLAAARVRDGGFRPRTLARLLRAYGAVGHVDRRLFLAAAEALTADGADGSGGWLAAPLDELSAAEVYQLACAYGRVGVAAPLLMDELLCRLARLLCGGGEGAGQLPARAAGRLLCVLAVLGHRPATVRQCTDGVRAASAAAARAAFCALRDSVLDGLAGMTSRHALAAVWALVRLQAAGAPAVLRMARLLARRAAPGATNLAVGLAAVAGTPAVSSSPPALARFVWVLGNGAAAAAADAERLRAAAAAAGVAATVTAAEDDAGGLPAKMHGGAAAAAAEAEAAAAAFFELSRGLLAVAEVLLRGGEPRGAELPSEVLIALAEALAALLARPPPRTHVGDSTGDGTGDNRSADSTAERLYDMLRGCFLTVAELALRRDPAMDGCLTAKELAALVHAMYDSGAAAARPAMRSAVARLVMWRLAAAQAGPASAALPPWPIPPPQGSRPPPSGGGRLHTQSPRQVNSQLAQQQQQQHMRRQRQQRHASAARLSPDDLARLLAAAARLRLFQHPVAQPAISDAVQVLVSSDRPPSYGTQPGRDGTDGAPRAAASEVQATAGLPPPAVPMLVPSPAALLDVLQYCGVTDASAPQESGPLRVEPGRGEEGSGRGGQGLYAPPQRRTSAGAVGVGVGVADAAAVSVSSGGGVQRALYSWAARQAVPLLPWLRAEMRTQVLAELGSVSVGESIATDVDVGRAGP